MILLVCLKNSTQLLNTFNKFLQKFLQSSSIPLHNSSNFIYGGPKWKKWRTAVTLIHMLYIHIILLKTPIPFYTHISTTQESNFVCH